MAMKFTKKAPSTTAQKTVEQKNKDGSKEVKEETFEQENLTPVAVPEKHAVVKMSAGKTINLTNFEFARVDVGIEMPCDVKDIDETLEYCSGWVNSKLEEMTS